LRIIVNAFVDKGDIIEIPIGITDVDGNPIELTFTGLLSFATFIRTIDALGRLTGLREAGFQRSAKPSRKVSMSEATSLPIGYTAPESVRKESANVLETIAASSHVKCDGSVLAHALCMSGSKS
jgi:hypothetical protein